MRLTVYKSKISFFPNDMSRFIIFDLWDKAASIVGNDTWTDCGGVKIMLTST